MAGKKTTRRASKKNGNRGETPITTVAVAAGTADNYMESSVLDKHPRELTLADGTCKKIKISSGEVDVKLPFNTNVDIELIVTNGARRRR